MGQVKILKKEKKNSFKGLILSSGNVWARPQWFGVIKILHKKLNLILNNLTFCVTYVSGK